MRRLAFAGVASRPVPKRVEGNPNDAHILVGDFNCASGSKAHEILTRDGGFTDLWTTAAERVNEKLRSFHGYERPVEDGLRIDWLLVRGPVKCDKAEIVTFNESGQYPSDHFPVAAWIQLPATR